MAETMRVAKWVRQGQLELVDVPMPRCGMDEVLVKISYCGICGSDLHRAFAIDGLVEGVMEPGRVLGHEYCGIVVEKGKNVTRLCEGNRVVAGGGPGPYWVKPEFTAFPDPKLPAWDPRFHVRRVRSGGQAGDIDQGGFAQYKRMLGGQPAVLPAGVSDLAGALAEPAAVALHAVRTSRMRLGDTVAVFGLGAVGLFVAECARLAGAVRVIGIDPAAQRRELALQMGATMCIDPTSSDPVRGMVEATEGQGADVIFDCAGVGETLDQSLTAVRPGGQVVYLALSFHPNTVKPGEWLARQVELKTVYGMSPEEWRQTVVLLEQGRIRTESMVPANAVFPLERIQEAFEASRGHRVVKAVIRP